MTDKETDKEGTKRQALAIASFEDKRAYMSKNAGSI